MRKELAFMTVFANFNILVQTETAKTYAKALAVLMKAGTNFDHGSELWKSSPATAKKDRTQRRYAPPIMQCTASKDAIKAEIALSFTTVAMKFSSGKMTSNVKIKSTDNTNIKLSEQ